MSSIQLREIMYGYSVEKIENQDFPKKLKVYIPELFPDTDFGNPLTKPVGKIANIFINASLVPVSQSVNTNNYLELPFIITGLNMMEMLHEEVEHNHDTSVSASASEGSVTVTVKNKATKPKPTKHIFKGTIINKGDRFIILFPNSNPNNGVILGKGCLYEFRTRSNH